MSEVVGLNLALLETVREPLLLVSEKLEVIEANPGFYQDFNLIDLQSIQKNWNEDEGIFHELKSLIASKIPLEKSIRDLKLTFTLQDVTKLYSVNVSPYFNSEKQIQEILISFQRIRNNQIPPIKNTNEIKNIEEIFSQAP